MDGYRSLLSGLNDSERIALYQRMVSAFNAGYKLERWAYQHKVIDKALTECVTELLDIRLAVSY